MDPPEPNVESTTDGDVALDPAVRRSIDLVRARFFGTEAPTIGGRFSLLEQIGAGGMGFVYAAWDRQLRRRVAVKLQAAAGRAGQRALREAQALARLAHANVVHVFEAGEFEGQIYLVMELVQGVTLGAWLAEAPRRWQDALRVVADAGRGLAAAHAVGLVHRDVKPENVMIGGDGRARLVDFGLARDVYAAPQAEVTLEETALVGEATRTGAVLGTPSYMAPEQRGGAAVDARSDQYSLCVTLWEAIYGARPRLDDTIADPRPPLRHVPKDRNVPGWLRRALARGLDPDPGRRWPSVDELLAALEQGAARRRRWAALGALSALVAAVGGAVGAERWAERQIAAECRTEADAIGALWGAEARRAVASAFRGSALPIADDTLARVLPVVDRFVADWADAADEVCRRHRLDRRWDDDLAARAQACLAEARGSLEALLPALQAEDASAVLHAGSAALQLPTPAECLDADAVRRRPSPPLSLDRREVQAILAGLAGDRALSTMGRYAEAAERARSRIADAESLDWPPLRARVRVVAGLLARDAALLFDGYLAAIAAGEASLASEAAADLARHRPESEEWLAVARAHAEAAASDPTPRIRVAVRSAEFERERGDIDTALARIDEARRLLPPAEVDPVRRGTIDQLTMSALVQRSGPGDLERAREIGVKALGRAEPLLGPDHPEVAAILSYLALASEYLGDFAQARASYERVIAIREAAYGAYHPMVLETLGNYAQFLAGRGEFEAALQAHGRALRGLTTRYGEDAPELIIDLVATADTHTLRGDRDEARALYERALAIVERTTGDTHTDYGMIHWGLGEIAREEGRLADAQRLLERGLEAQRRRGNRGALPELLFGLAVTLRQRDVDAPRAEALAREAAAIWRSDGEVSASQGAEVEAWLAGGAPPH